MCDHVNLDSLHKLQVFLKKASGLYETFIFKLLYPKDATQTYTKLN